MGWTPGQASLIAPSGGITNNQPAFSWNVPPATATTDPATWYYLYISGPSGYVFANWYRASTVCGGSTCSIANPTTFSGGNYRWWIQSWNAAGYGPWSTVKEFSIPVPPPPGRAILNSPNGTTTNNPTYNWNKVSDATWYYVYISGPSGYVFTNWYRASTVCGASTCSIANATPGLSSGAHRWWVQTWNSSGGYGPWSAGMNFTVSP